MSESGPYQDDPYRRRDADAQQYLFAQEGSFRAEQGVDHAQGGYYSADYAGAQPVPYQMVPYQVPPEQPYGQPYSQQYAYPPAPYGPYVPYGPYGPGAYWGVAYDPRRYEANALGGWALGLGIASLFIGCYFGIMCGIPAIIVGVKGMRAADEGRATNKGLSIAGVVLGSVGAAINAIYLVFFIAAYMSV
ncbi:hypothetical protein [Actinomyces viscosus]|uniref:hypothetical protein n=1 Tax=Actinomyces viscosus TaxID=1656 RepID=UPI0028F0F11A|nr:hypothetical protein [Actinomyces viscosus]